ncbi:MAG: hypothetical protein ABID84_02835 [Chloroflexota bacterium]
MVTLSIPRQMERRSPWSAYSHVLPGLQEAAALALDERLARGQNSDTDWLWQNVHVMSTDLK